ncbi:MAG: hypothetical protein ACTIJ6_05320 [Leucobacter sp.]
MAEKTIELRGNTYPAPHIDRMKRKAIKKLKPLLAELQGEDMEALWDLVGALVPGLPAKDLDDLDLGECKALLSDAGVAKFSNDAPEQEITAGESSASTNS